MTVYLTPALAELAFETMDDVYTPNGKAGTIEALTSKEALVVGRDLDHWYYIDVLTASAALLRNAEKETTK